MLKLEAGRTRSAGLRRCREGRAEMRAAVPETRLAWVKVVMSGGAERSVRSCQTMVRSAGVGRSELEGSCGSVVEPFSSMTSCHTLTFRRFSAKEGTPFQSMCRLVFSTTQVMRRRFWHCLTTSSSGTFPAAQIRPSADVDWSSS